LRAARFPRCMARPRHGRRAGRFPRCMARFRHGQRAARSPRCMARSRRRHAQFHDRVSHWL